MRSRKTVEELRSKRLRGTAYKANANRSTRVLTLRHDDFIERSNHSDTSADEFDRIDLLACLFGSHKIK